MGMTAASGIPSIQPVQSSAVDASTKPKKKEDSLLGRVKSAIPAAVESGLDFTTKVTKYTPPVFGLSGFQLVHSLSRIGAKVRKTIHALRDLKSIQAQLQQAEQALSKARMGSASQAVCIQLSATVATLSRKKEKCLSRLYSIRSLPSPILDLATATITLAYSIGKAVNTLAPTVLNGLETATTILGAAAGGLTILLGGYSLVSSVLHCKEARQKQERVSAQLETIKNPSRTGIAPETWSLCKKMGEINLKRAQIKAQKTWRISLLKACASAMATVGGILGIASAFTGGAAAVGIAIAAVVLGIIGASIGVVSYFSTRRLKKELEAMPRVSEQDCETLATQLIGCTQDQQEEIKGILDISESIPNDPAAIAVLLRAQFLK